jgi:hypothetical protein
VRNPMMTLAAVTLSATVVTSALAGPAGSGAGHGGAASPSGRGFVPPAETTVPAMPAPTFNQAQPYTVPQSPEVRVSPGSPGSVFGDR